MSLASQILALATRIATEIKSNKAIAANASNLTSGTVPNAQLPARLNYAPLVTSDWNNCVENGWYAVDGGGGGANCPEATWTVGIVTGWGDANWVTQTVHCFTADWDSDTHAYTRDMNAGTWTAWKRVRSTQTELDLRYLNASNLNAGTVPDARLTGRLNTPSSGIYNLGVTGPSGSWIRLFTINGQNPSNGASVSALIAGQGNIGTAARTMTVLHVGQRGDNLYTAQAWSFGAPATGGPWGFYVKQISTYVFEVWAQRTGYDSAVAVKVLDTWNATINLDLEGGTAPSGTLNPVTALDVNNASSLTSGTLPDARLPGRLLDGANNSISDPNTAQTTGFFYVNATTNGPSGPTDYFLTVNAYNTSYVVQTAHDFRTNRRWTRQKAADIGGGAWWAWTEIDVSDVAGGHVPSNLRAQANLSGGGTVTLDGSWNLKWTDRFIVISNGRGPQFSTAGFFDIVMPTVGTVIPGTAGAADQTVTASGVPIADWTALYYILPIGASQASVNGNFRILGYTAGSFKVPDNWILIAVRNSDATGQFVKLGDGRILLLGRTSTPGNPYQQYSLTGHTHPASDLTATGTRDSTTFLRGDNIWAVPAGGTPSGSAGGSLSGSYPNPGLAAGAVGSTEINNAIKDAVATTASLRTLGTGPQQAAAGNHGHSYAALGHSHPESDVTNLVADLATKAPSATPTFTGVLTSTGNILVDYVYPRTLTNVHFPNGIALDGSAINMGAGSLNMASGSINGVAGLTVSSGDITVSNGSVFLSSLPASTLAGTVVHMGTSGKLYKYTSSRRFKDNIEAYHVDADKVLEVDSYSYTGLLPDDDPDVRTVGLLAEQLEDLGLGDLAVVYDAEGLPDSVSYDRFAAIGLLAVAKKQQKQLAAQQAQLDAQEKRLAALERRVAALE